ncbi:Piso0_005196 [Millerozyma farinosa CBS 7064]|uniref:Piso0_005196 protein n=1 Tax=Pichia sorbitophila (strain ATCC MYA-4447 / BCRC 22081 / CBS 7064 / NBRC 10061 / NRRL Y-12695) TaxID=559304 RepID=G8Y1I8_PICSO|nr:Piso0_005196 [Millerozyma farinosa CBS 7064]
MATRSPISSGSVALKKSVSHHRPSCGRPQGHSVHNVSEDPVPSRHSRSPRSLSTARPCTMVSCRARPTQTLALKYYGWCAAWRLRHRESQAFTKQAHICSASDPLCRYAAASVRRAAVGSSRMMPPRNSGNKAREIFYLSDVSQTASRGSRGGGTHISYKDAISVGGGRKTVVPKSASDHRI